MQETVESQFAYYSQKAGDLSRQLGLAAIALIWLFHTGPIPKTAGGALANAIPRAFVPEQFRWPILLIAASLWIDAVQYVVGTLSWGGLWFTGHDKELGCDHKPDARVQTAFIVLKLSFMLAAYSFLIPAVWGFFEWSKVTP